MAENRVEDSLKLIKKWIFEHACKYGMNGVMRAIFQKNGDKSLSHLNDVSFVKPNPAFMFVTLVEVFQETLKTEEMTLDNSLLIMITEILEELYKKNNFVPIKQFMNAVTRLKLMELLKLMANGIDSSDVVRRVNIHFPRWDKNTQNMIQKQFKISSLTSLKKAEKAMIVCRRFILGLLVSKDKWRNYQTNNYDKDIKQFAETVNKELVEMMNVLRPELPPSPIEQVLNGAKEDLANSDDAAIQILLEHLHVGMDETDFLRLLETLEPETESQINPEPFACILDDISESASVTGDNKNISDEESDTSTIVFVDEASHKGTDSPETLLCEKDISIVYQNHGKHHVVFLDDSPTEEVSAPRKKAQKLVSNSEEEEENEKDPKVKSNENRKRGRPRKKSEVVIPCSDESSDDSEIEILPDLGRHLTQDYVKPCIVKLYETMVIKTDIKYQIYS